MQTWRLKHCVDTDGVSLHFKQLRGPEAEVQRARDDHAEKYARKRKRDGTEADAERERDDAQPPRGAPPPPRPTRDPPRARIPPPAPAARSADKPAECSTTSDSRSRVNATHRIFDSRGSSVDSNKSAWHRAVIARATAQTPSTSRRRSDPTTTPARAAASQTKTPRTGTRRGAPRAPNGTTPASSRARQCAP